jgi:hypothetical protein
VSIPNGRKGVSAIFRVNMVEAESLRDLPQPISATKINAQLNE